MKKLLLSLALAFVGLCANAQFIFVDKDGNEIPNGSVVNVVESEIDPFTGGQTFHSGLFIKNTSSDNAQVILKYNIIRLDNGIVQCCFPSICMTKNELGVYTTDAGELYPGRPANIQSEWCSDGEGMCTVAYTILAGLQEGPTVTVHYCNGVYPANISSLLGNNDAKGYNLQGQIVDSNYRGVVIRNGKKYIQ